MALITPKQITINEVSTEVFSAASSKWKQFFEITNDWDYKIYLAFGNVAEIWKWTPLNSWDRYYLNYTDWIDEYFIKAWCNAISLWGTSSLAIQEFDYSNNN